MASNDTTFGTSVGAGEESTYGTAVARAVWVKLASASLMKNTQYNAENNLGVAGDTSRIHRARHKGFVEAGGELSGEISYDDGWLMILKHAMGTLGTTGAGPYTHAFTLGELPTGLTLELIKGDSGDSEVFDGCKIAQMVLACEAGQVATWSATVMGEDSARGSAGTPTYSSNGERVIHGHAGTLSFNSVSYNLKSWRVTLDNAIRRVNHIGSYLTAEPAPSGYRAISMEITLHGTYAALRTAFHAQTQADATIVFTSGSKTFTVKVSQAQLEAFADPEGSAGLYETTATLVPINDGTDKGLVVTVVNGNSSGIAN